VLSGLDDVLDVDGIFEVDVFEEDCACVPEIAITRSKAVMIVKSFIKKNVGN
jgi:hypothetical protein